MLFNVTLEYFGNRALCLFEVVSIFPLLVLVKKKTLQKAKKLFKVSLLLLSKDSLVNCFGKTSRISASSFSSSSVICVNIFCHGKDTIQFLHHLRSHSNKARLKSGKAKSTSQSSGFTDVFLSIFG